MSDTLIAAILSVVAVAILAPTANHFITNYRERRSIRATLRVHEAPLPALLRKYFQACAIRHSLKPPLVPPSTLDSSTLSIFLKAI